MSDPTKQENINDKTINVLGKFGEDSLFNIDPEIFKINFDGFLETESKIQILTLWNGLTDETLKRKIWSIYNVINFIRQGGTIPFSSNIKDIEEIIKLQDQLVNLMLDIEFTLTLLEGSELGIQLTPLGTNYFQLLKDSLPKIKESTAIVIRSYGREIENLVRNNTEAKIRSFLQEEQ